MLPRRWQLTPHYRNLILLSISSAFLVAISLNEKAEVFDSLPTATQKRLQRGRINVGDTQDMVYIALGHPDETREIANADGEQTLWVYKTYWQQYEGTAWLGYRRVIVPARSGRNGS